MTLNQARIAVTGATGFIGRRVSARLLNLGAQVIGLSNVASEATVSRGVQPLLVDVTDREAVIKALTDVRPTHVLHLAAVGVTDPFVPIAFAQTVNVAGTCHVLEASLAAGVARLVHVGTAYERPARTADPVANNPYVASKLAAWRAWCDFVRQTALNSVAVRLFHVYGPGQSVRGLIPEAIKAAFEQTAMRMTPGEQRRDFVYIDDVIDGLVTCLTATDRSGETFDLGTGYSRSVLEAVRSIFHAINKHDNFTIDLQDYRPNEFMVLTADPEPIARAWGWRASTSFEAGIAATIEWYRQHGFEPSA